jgi:hypothetical protein
MRAPVGLGADGRRLWRSVAAWLSEHEGGAITLDPHEREILAEACRVADRIAGIRDALDGADLTDAGSIRLLAEERQQRAALASLLVSKLAFPTGMPADVPSKGTTPRSRRAQTAARARWGDQRDEAS